MTARPPDDDVVDLRSETLYDRRGRRITEDSVGRALAAFEDDDDPGEQTPEFPVRRA
ncbi:hypothetical protein MOQ72_34240 [Saccharopolyspora sp. K220]|uniref:hypothetical protein n=1 Tax=Saccharopolyspora soli TaxID=2926618 RepID=UPI001F583EFE|nr:hypothetical protein [Saccharopolyspora soli]MCI2422500.1 hypothetical protein [Saccharopolyspora soli]